MDIITIAAAALSAKTVHVSIELTPASLIETLTYIDKLEPTEGTLLPDGLVDIADAMEAAMTAQIAATA